VVGLTVPVLTSERLRLVPVSDAHLPLFIELNSDPEVMRFIRGGPSTPQESRREWTRRRGPQTDEARGLGYWAGFEGERFVGWWSASSFADDLKTSGVGYRLRREAWGRGLATEGGRVMVNQAFGALSVEKVVASTISANAASRAVLRKLGMTPVDTRPEDRDDRVPGREQGKVVYELARRDPPRGELPTFDRKTAP
jgi:RimJ/RimL family protein N-acetyltransferase